MFFNCHMVNNETFRYKIAKSCFAQLNFVLFMRILAGPGLHGALNGVKGRNYFCERKRPYQSPSGLAQPAGIANFKLWTTKIIRINDWIELNNHHWNEPVILKRCAVSLCKTEEINVYLYRYYSRSSCQKTEFLETTRKMFSPFFPTLKIEVSKIAKNGFFVL